MKCRFSKKTLAIWGGLLAFSSVLLFFISPDSYLNDMHTRADSAWFFMCGKAWMNGLVPYVDFADSKGPLLWLIYGIGYLINHTSYVGVYWISCLWYSLVYFLTYKIALLFLKDNRKSLVCAFLMTLAFFNPWFHNEIRAEDFCLLFMTWSLYRVCILLYSEHLSEKEELRSFGILGVCFAALFLIKFNIAAMQAILIICSLYYLVREKKGWLKPFLYGLGGFSLVVLPFVIYFLIAGNFTAFIHEYLLNTLQTVDKAAPNETNILLDQVATTNPILLYILEWGDIVYCPELAALLLMLVLGGILFLHQRNKYGWMPLIVSIAIFSLAIRHHFMYYFNICSFLAIFLMIGTISLFNKPLPRWAVPLIAFAAVSIIVPFHILTYNFKILFFNDNINQRDYYKATYLMSQVEQPRLVYAYGHELGFGVPVGTLPAGKYWTKQTGITDQMLEEHNNLILSGKADFIFIHESSFEQPGYISETMLASAGYHEYLRIGEGENIILFSNHENLDVKEYATPSRKDLFLKKNYLTTIRNEN